ncbi:hypothetical protein Hanom_Chr11g00974001 [Helianthus anomalus]
MSKCHVACYITAFFKKKKKCYVCIRRVLLIRSYFIDYIKYIPCKILNLQLSRVNYCFRPCDFTFVTISIHYSSVKYRD